MCRAGDHAGMGIRLDELVLRRGLAPDLRTAAALILGGEIWSGDQRLDKAGARIDESTPIERRPRRRFVSRGGEKLEGALEQLRIDVTDLDCLDLGSSTGGFVDCLLRRGASRVIAVDVGHGQLDWGLRNDPRVTALENCNVRYLRPEDLIFPPDLITADLSFISLKSVLPAIRSLAPAPALVLVKPQFEADRAEVEPGGVIHDAELRARIVDRVAAAAKSRGFEIQGRTESVLAGRQGNREVFLLLGNPPQNTRPV